MFFLYFLAGFFFCFFFTALVRFLMRRFGIVDKPKTSNRKIHKKTTPLGGGLAIFVSFFLLIGIALFTGQIGAHLSEAKLIGVFLGGLFLMVGGVLDDKYTLKPKFQIVFPVIASLCVLWFGIGLEGVTNPFGGVFSLAQWQVAVDGLGTWVVLADTVVFFWLMGMMFTTKLLDGLDGLVVGVVSIGALVIFFLSNEARWFQPEVALVALVFAGSCLGFLVWNWHPAKIFLGQGGSLFLGYILGVLAIISGGKIATTLLVIGIPMLDVGRVVVRRIQKKKSIFLADTEHLHFRLLASGLSHKQAVLLFYSISFLFGMSTLFLQSSQKFLALFFLFILMLLVGVRFSKKES